MRAIMICLLACFLLSCSGKKETAKEEKIRIIVEHERSDSRSAPPPGLMGKRHPELPPSDPTAVLPPSDQRTPPDVDNSMVPPAQPFHEEGFVDFREVRDIIRTLADNDPKIGELIRQAQIPPLARYLQDQHPSEIAMIAERVRIKDERRIAVQLSKLLIHKQQLMKRPRMKPGGLERGKDEPPDTAP